MDETSYPVVSAGTKQYIWALWCGKTSEKEVQVIPKTHISVVNRWHKKATKILHAGRLKIWQWMKRVIQWFPRLRSDMFERYAAEKLLKMRYYCHQTSFSCEPYVGNREDFTFNCRKNSIVLYFLFHDHHPLADILTSTASIHMLLVA